MAKVILEIRVEVEGDFDECWSRVTEIRKSVGNAILEKEVIETTVNLVDKKPKIYAGGGINIPQPDGGFLKIKDSYASGGWIKAGYTSEAQEDDNGNSSE